MDVVFSNSSLLFRQPLAPIRTVASTHSIFSTSSSKNQNQLLFSSQSKLSLPSLNASKVPKFSIHCGASSSSSIKEINEGEFPNTVLKSDRLVLVEFVATWCGPCRLIAPSVEWLAQEYRDKLTVVKIDHDANPRLIEEYKVYGLPTLILFKNGQEVLESRREGAITKAKLKAYIDSLLDSISVT